MKYKPPTLLILLSCSIFLMLPAQALLADATGQAMVRRASVVLDEQRSVSLEIRHRIAMFGQHLVGTGSYQQADENDQRRLRLDMKVKVGEQTTSMQQICNGRFLYIRRDFGQNSTLGRVDLQRVHKALGASRAGTAGLDTSSQWMLIGGLPQLLARLEKNFQFSSPREATLENSPVHVVDGVWKQHALHAMLPATADGAALPDQLPTQVRLVVRGSDGFPLRIEYLRPSAPAADAAEDAPPLTPIMTMELFEIQLGQPIDPLTFVYKPGNQEVSDHTEMYIRSLGLEQNKSAQQESESTQR